MTIPLWFWPLLCVVLLELLVWIEIRSANRSVENFRAVEDERRARLLTAPLGNVDPVRSAPVFDHEDT